MYVQMLIDTVTHKLTHMHTFFTFTFTHTHNVSDRCSRRRFDGRSEQHVNGRISGLVDGGFHRRQWTR